MYTELADYTIACLKALKASERDTKILVIHYPVNAEAPFVLDRLTNLKAMRSLSRSCELFGLKQSFVLVGSTNGMFGFAAVLRTRRSALLQWTTIGMGRSDNM